MPDPTTVVRSYIEMWNETDPQRRRELVAQTVTDDARYLDPIMSLIPSRPSPDIIGSR